MAETKKRRKRSKMSVADAQAAVKAFAKLVQRFGETDDPGMFQTRLCNLVGKPLCPPGETSVQFMVRGNFGVGDDVFEAIRVLAGHKLPRAATRKAVAPAAPTATEVPHAK